MSIADAEKLHKMLTSAVSGQTFALPKEPLFNFVIKDAPPIGDPLYNSVDAKAFERSVFRFLRLSEPMPAMARYHILGLIGALIDYMRPDFTEGMVQVEYPSDFFARYADIMGRRRSGWSQKRTADSLKLTVQTVRRREREAKSILIKIEKAIQAAKLHASRPPSSKLQ